VVWNTFYFSIQLGISSSQLTFKGVETTMAALLVPPAPAAQPAAQPVAVAATRQAKEMGLWGGGKFVF